MPTYKFKAVFTRNGAGVAPGSAPTVTIVDTSNTVLVNAAAASSLSNLAGVYYYNYTGSAADCIAKFVTSDATVDEPEKYDYTPQVITDYIDASIATVKAKTDNLPTDPADQSAVEAAITAAAAPLMTSAGYTAPDNAGITAIKAKTDNLPASPAATGDAMALTSGERSTLAGVVWAYASRSLTTFSTLVADIWAYASRTLTSIGRVTVVSPVLASGDITLVRGDDYAIADGRPITWSFTSAVTLTGATVALQIADQTGACTVSGTNPNYSVSAELTAAQTTALAEGVLPFSVKATLSGGHIVTLIAGSANVQ